MLRMVKQRLGITFIFCLLWFEKSGDIAWNTLAHTERARGGESAKEPVHTWMDQRLLSKLPSKDCSLKGLQRNRYVCVCLWVYAMVCCVRSASPFCCHWMCHRFLNPHFKYLSGIISSQGKRRLLCTRCFPSVLPRQVDTNTSIDTHFIREMYTYSHILVLIKHNCTQYILYNPLSLSLSFIQIYIKQTRHKFCLPYPLNSSCTVLTLPIFLLNIPLLPVLLF